MVIETLELPGSRAPLAAEDGWQPLPLRGRLLFRISHALGLVIPAIGLSLAGVLFLGDRIHLPGGAWPIGAGVLLAAALFGFWLGGRRHSYYAWRLDRHGFGLRSGKLFFKDVRVPLSRVQHLDIKRGPLERWRDLSTLIIHTAGTREHAVSVPVMDAAAAEHLRDVLARASGLDDDED